MSKQSTVVETLVFSRLMNVMDDSEQEGLAVDAFNLSQTHGQDAVASNYAFWLNREIELELVDLETRIGETREECVNLKAERDAYVKDHPKYQELNNKFKFQLKYLKDLISSANTYGRQEDETEVFQSDASTMAGLLEILRNHAELAKSGEYRAVYKKASSRSVANSVSNANAWYLKLFLYAEDQLKVEADLREYATEQLLRLASATSIILYFLTRRADWRDESVSYTNKLNAYVAKCEETKSLHCQLMEAITSDNELNFYENMPQDYKNDRNWLTEDEIITYIDMTR